jgi:hypothetical protein
VQRESHDDQVPRFSGPAIDARVDITDVYVFASPVDPGKTVLIANVNPLAPAHASDFRPDAVYETLIDIDDDARPDIALRCRFTPKSGDRQSARLTRAELTVELTDGHIHEELETEILLEDAPVSFGATPLVTEGPGGVRFFAGLRSDPFFFDLEAYASGLYYRQPTSDFFAGKNVFSIVAEVPNPLLGAERRIGVWSRTLLPMTRQRDHLTQFDQAGALPTVLFNNYADQVVFGRTPPTLQSAAVTTSGQTFLESFTARFERAGSYPREEAERLARALFPDILWFDSSRPGGFPNGRRLHDDVAGLTLRMLTGGAVRADMLPPHPDYLTVFPYLGHPVTATGPTRGVKPGCHS